MPIDGDVTVASAARMLDYLLGDARNFAADRRLAEVLRHAVPDIDLLVRLGRTFMRHAVTHLVGAGVHQFLDLSVGTTAIGNVHEVAQAIVPTCRVVYAHADPISVVHTSQLLADAERTAVLHADPRDARKIMTACRDDKLLDITAPIGLMMASGLALLPASANLANMVSRYRRCVVGGSHLVISHITGDRRPVDVTNLVRVMNASRDPVQPRTRDEVIRLFSGFELVPPGVVDPGQWQLERSLSAAEEVAATMVYVGVGRKPGSRA
ncbi:SAM-dependent methyltransferase [Actinophytocola oryzae]|uniref:SAM-dependent methyltransferase n=1 Tax=Actinophytocola oryzae TaxID=502181 RepID=UPI0014150C72|nr:SAM-dependent methyltransferase [Actinophytocola oryzae]